MINSLLALTGTPADLALVYLEYVGWYARSSQNAVGFAAADHVPVHFKFFRPVQKRRQLPQVYAWRRHFPART